MGSKMARRVESHLTFVTSAWIHIETWKWFFFEMDCRDVFLEGGMFSEGFLAGRILSAAVLVSPIVRGEMTTKP